MYLPSHADLTALRFKPALSTGGIWHHSQASLWVVLLPPTAYALSTTQYDAGTRYEAATHTKSAFYAALCAAAPEWDFAKNKKKP